MFPAGYYNVVFLVGVGERSSALGVLVAAAVGEVWTFMLNATL